MPTCMNKLACKCPVSFYKQSGCYRANWNWIEKDRIEIGPDEIAKDWSERDMDAYNEYVSLMETINYHMDCYYNKDLPEISDYEYDQLMLRLKAIEKEHPDWILADSPTQKIGGTTKREAGVEVTHHVPMLSIQDVFSKEEVESWISEVKAVYPDATFSVEQKIDGLSMSLRYQDGSLILAETRGNGLVGEDVTLNARVIKDVKQTIPFKDYVELRGEVYMSHEDFEAFNAKQEELGKKPAANPRNLAAGTLRQLDSRITKERGLRMFVFNIQDATGESAYLMKEHTKGLDALKMAGIETIPAFLCHTKQEVLDAIDRIGESRGELPYDLDGAVIKIEKIGFRQDFPAGSKYSAGHIAYKYPPEEKEVVIEEIEVAVGRTGKMTFRAKFKDPVRLCGTNVLRATLHNADFIRSMNIAQGCTAICRKQGEIIPAIVRVIKPAAQPYKAPVFCPICKHKLVKEEETCDIYCKNPSCPAQLKRTVAYFASKDAMDIKNFGSSYVDMLVDQGYIHDFGDLYTLKNYRDELIEKGIMGKEKNTDKILAAIEDSKNNEAYKLLTGLAISNVGKVSAKEIMKCFASIDELAMANIDALEGLNDVGFVTAKCIYEYFRDEENRRILQKLRSAGVNMEQKKVSHASSKLEGLTFVVTGTLANYGRKEIGDLIEENGGKNTSSVSKKTDYLIAGEAAGSKLTKAKELGIPVLSEEDFLNMLK